MSAMDKNTALVRLGEWLGVPPNAIEVRLYVGEPELYTIVLQGVEVPLGDTRDLLSQQTVRAAVAKACKSLPKKVDGRYWDDVVEAILAAATELEVPGATDRDRAADWVAGYLDIVAPTPEGSEQYPMAVQANAPLLKGEQVLVSAMALARFLSTQNIRVQNLPMLLRRAGASPVRVKSEGVYRRYWDVSSLLPYSLHEAPWANHGFSGKRQALEGSEASPGNGGVAKGLDGHAPGQSEAHEEVWRLIEALRHKDPILAAEWAITVNRSTMSERPAQVEELRRLLQSMQN